MEEDKHLKQILMNSAEGASAGFTDAVLKRIQELSLARSYDKPMVPAKWVRVFLLTLGFIVATILLLCLMVALSPIDVAGWIKSTELPEIGYNKIIVFIFCFWIVFAVNAMVEKKLMNRQSN